MDEGGIQDRDKELKSLLSRVAVNEKRSRTRNLVFLLIPLFAGLLWLFFSLNRVRTVERQAENTNRALTDMQKSAQQANAILSSLASSEGIKKRKEIDIEYNVPDREHNDIRTSLIGFGFSAERIKGTTGASGANTISYQKDVDEVNVKLVAYAFIRAGARIKTIEPLADALEQTLIIRVYSDSRGLDKADLTVEQIRDMRLNFAFPVIGSFKNKDNAFNWARKVEAATTEYKPEIYVAEKGLYAVTLGGYLTEAEAQTRIDFANAKGDLATDKPFIRVSQTWGENIFVSTPQQ
jgi:hypothetical protein